MTNESIFVMIQYNFVLIHELVSDHEVRNQVGNVIIGLTLFLLALNLLVIVVVTLRPAIRKCYLTCVKNKKIRQYKAVQVKRRDVQVKRLKQLDHARTKELYDRYKNDLQWNELDAIKYCLGNNGNVVEQIAQAEFLTPIKR